MPSLGGAGQPVLEQGVELGRLVVDLQVNFFINSIVNTWNRKEQGRLALA